MDFNFVIQTFFTLKQCYCTIVCMLGWVYYYEKLKNWNFTNVKLKRLTYSAMRQTKQ